MDWWTAVLASARTAGTCRPASSPDRPCDSARRHTASTRPLRRAGARLRCLRPDRSRVPSDPDVTAHPRPPPRRVRAPRSPMSFAWVANYISKQLPRAERAVERGHHAVALERVLVAHEADDPVDIAAPRRQVVVIAHLRLKVNLPQPIEVVAKRISNLRRHPIDRTVTLHERQRLLRPA